MHWNEYKIPVISLLICEITLWNVENYKKAVPFYMPEKTRYKSRKIYFFKSTKFWNLVTIFRFTMINALKQEQNAWHCCFLICEKKNFLRIMRKHSLLHGGEEQKIRKILHNFNILECCHDLVCETTLWHFENYEKAIPFYMADQNILDNVVTIFRFTMINALKWV